ncbi:MAG: hypothetical protein HY646_02195 [Acidobacteria bacterium]|nr:hypothetical protein [Acidobacteriota bacterium]
MTPEERFERIEIQIDKNTAAIRDLILVSRTLLTSVKDTDSKVSVLVTSIGELRDAQKQTDQKLNVLIETVDRFVRSWQKPNGQQ